MKKNFLRVKHKDHVSCLSSIASRLLSEFLQVPEFLQGVQARNFLKSQSPYEGDSYRRVTPRTSLGLRHQAVFEGEGSTASYKGGEIGIFPSPRA